MLNLSLNYFSVQGTRLKPIFVPLSDSKLTPGLEKTLKIPVPFSSTHCRHGRISLVPFLSLSTSTNSAQGRAKYQTPEIESFSWIWIKTGTR